MALYNILIKEQKMSFDKTKEKHFEFLTNCEKVNIYGELIKVKGYSVKLVM